jgi:hypothetical protein
MCSTPCTTFDCSPQPPTFEQFVRWGQAAASYEFLKSEEFTRTAQRIATAIGLSAAVFVAFNIVAVVAANVGPALYAGLQALATMWLDMSVAWVPTAITPYSTLTAATVGAVAAIVLVAILIAVTRGDQVVTAAELPGQLAELIVDARTDPPDVAELMDTDDGVTSLFAMFVAATLPAPMDDYCDNSLGPWFEFVPDVWAYRSGACLNAPAIPAASPFDPQFVITENGKPGRTVSPTITWRDPAAGTTATARLHDNWFITEPAGSLDEQMLSINYTGWDGERRSAFVLGDPDHGAAFVSLNVSGDLSGLEDCLDNGLCSQSETLRYLGPDGEKLSASLERWSPPVGAPAYDPTPDEEFAVSYKANGFAPGGATGAVSYRWRFEASDCRMMCTILAVGGGTPYEAATVAGETVTHRWGHPGTFTVELTATDSEKRSATTTFEVQAQDVAPRIVEFVPDCPTDADGDPRPGPNCLARTGGTGTARQLRGKFVDRSTLIKRVDIDWGDGSPVARECATDLPPQPPFTCNPVAGNGLEVTPTIVAGTRGFAFDASHVYTAPGIYQGTMTVTDQLGVASETFTMTIGETPAVVVTTHTHDGVLHVAEDGATSRDIDVRLAAAPTQDVTVYFAVDDHHDLDVPETITFTPDNWDHPQTVTVRAVDDDYHEPDPHRATITIGVAGGPDANIEIDRVVLDSSRSTVPVDITDNDQAGIVSPTKLNLTEDGPSATVTVGISSTPTDGSRVDIKAVARGLCTVTPDRLTDIQHNKPQTLTVTPGRDHHPGGRHCTVHLFTRSSDPDYADRRVDLTGTVTNIDTPAVTVTPTHLRLHTTEANPTATYQIVLDTSPIADVEITPTTTDPELTVSGPVTFTPDNWDQPQTVTLTTPAGTTPHATEITHEVTTDDTDYTAITPADVHVAVGDPATTLTLTAPDQPTTTKQATVTATLSADVGDPTGNVVFSVDGSSPCDVGTPGCGTTIVHGVAQFHPGLLPLGTHTITATYPGDATHHPASASIDVVVTEGTPEPVDDTTTTTAVTVVPVNDPPPTTTPPPSPTTTQPPAPTTSSP